MHDKMGGLVTCIVEMTKHRKLLSEIMKVRDRLRHAGVDERIIFKYILKIGCHGVNWIHLAQIECYGGLF
jgi:hypothetical protein